MCSIQTRQQTAATSNPTSPVTSNRDDDEESDDKRLFPEDAGNHDHDATIVEGNPKNEVAELRRQLQESRAEHDQMASLVTRSRNEAKASAALETEIRQLKERLDRSESQPQDLVARPLPQFTIPKRPSAKEISLQKETLKATSERCVVYDAEIIRAESHRAFLVACSDKGVIPKGLKPNSTPPVVERSATNVSQWFSEALYEAKTNLVASLFMHYEILLDKYTATRAEIGKHLVWLEEQDICDMDWTSVCRNTALAKKELNARREALKREHDEKLMALVYSQSSESESTTTTTNIQDQEKQACMGLLGIEPSTETDPYDEDEDGNQPLIYLRHVLAASQEAQRA